LRVDRFWGNGQLVSPGPRLQGAGVLAERLAELGDVDLQSGGGARVGFLPQLLDQAIGGQELPGVQHEQRHQRALLAPAQKERPAIPDDLERAQDPELDSHPGRTLAPL
jgi:hypothetical protein